MAYEFKLPDIGEGLVEGPRDHPVGPVDGLPRLAGEQARRDAGRGQQEREPPTAHGAVLYGVTQSGRVTDTAALPGSNSP